MVKVITGLTGSGLKDWYLQRLTAVILVVYVLFLLGFVLAHGGITQAIWSGLFSHVWMRVFTLLALLGVVLHAWVGMWTILTDYVHCGLVRGTLQTIFILAFVIEFIYGVHILWS
jgi:succinate dehydrogenase / fumarate reductase membrane anchor subunit